MVLVTVLLLVAVVGAVVGAVVFTWTRLEPFHRAQRDADRVFTALTGTAPVSHQRSGNYLGFDQVPTVQAYGPLTTPTTVRAEMARFATALAAAGYRPDPWSQNAQQSCSLTGDSFWAPDQPAPATVRVRCAVDGSDAHRTAHASLVLDFQVSPALLHPTRTATGYFTVSGDSALDLQVSSGTLEAGAWRDL